MSFGTQVKEELCRGEPARKCCARAEAYGVLLFCHTFAPREIKVVTGSAAFAGRLPELFRRAFRLSFDQRPEPGEAGKRIFLIHDPDKLSAIREIYGIDPAVSLAHHINFAVLEEDHCRKMCIRDRYKETRRIHPLAKNGRSLAEAVRVERTALEPVRQRAEYIVDTSALSTAKLRGEMLRLFGEGDGAPAMSVSVISFGFKYGIPIEADLVFDVRFLPNPYYIAELRDQTGLDDGVRDFVFGYQQTRDFMKHLENLMGFLLPLYVEEGKTALVIGVGCTGGHHRSVAVTRALADFIRQKGYSAAENHRDMTRD